MKNRGKTHIEVILAFILFIGAVGFALYFFNPADSNRLIDSTISYAFRDVFKNTSVTLEEFYVVVNGSNINTAPGGPENNKIIAINISNVDPKLNVTVRNDSGVIFNASRGKTTENKDFVYVEYPYEQRWPEKNELIYIYFTQDIRERNPIISPTSPQIVHNKTFYTISSSVPPEKVISERRFRQLNISYNLDYSGTRERFNLPRRIDYGFSLFFSENDKIESAFTKPGEVEVFSRKERTKVIRTNGEIGFADFIVRVW